MREPVLDLTCRRCGAEMPATFAEVRRTGEMLACGSCGWVLDLHPSLAPGKDEDEGHSVGSLPLKSTL